MVVTHSFEGAIEGIFVLKRKAKCCTVLREKLAYASAEFQGTDFLGRISFQIIVSSSNHCVMLL